MISEGKLRSIIRNSIKKILNEAMDEEFSFDELSSMRNFSQMVRYCKSHLGMPIGNGSSRMVFQIDDEKCLKIAKNEKGVAQNSAEYDWYAQSYGIFPNLYNSADDGRWILVEYVLPASKKDFKVCLGIDFNVFQEFVAKCYKSYSNQKYARYMNPSISDEAFEQMLENNEWLEQLYTYMSDYQVPFGDLQRLSNIGLVQRSGKPQIVILDSGLTQSIYDEYYGRR